MTNYADRANFHYTDTTNCGCYIYCCDANGYSACIHRVDSAVAARIWISEAKSKLMAAMSRS